MTRIRHATPIDSSAIRRVHTEAFGRAAEADMVDALVAANALTISLIAERDGHYPRFGFVRASQHGLRWEHPCPDESFMVLELREGALSGRAGIVRYRPELSR